MRRETSVAIVTALVLGATALVQAQTVPDIVAAARSGDLDRLRTLVAGGPDVNAPQGDGATALHWAAHRDDTAAVQLLIDSGARVNAANDLGATPLWLASTSGSALLVGALLEAGADPRLALRMGETPLMAAARAGNIPALTLLLEHGADVSVAEHERGQTALMWAAAQQQTDAVRVLLDHGADLHARTTVWHQLENTAGNTNGSGNVDLAHGGSTPLLFVARNGNLETAEVLVAAGADVNDTAASGTSVLVIAAHSGHSDLGIYLLSKGADPDAAKGGYTALHAAVLRGQRPLVETLLEHGADPNLLVERGTPGRRFSADFSLRHRVVGANAFWLAAKFGELEILRVLAEHGADANLSPYSGESSLKAAMGVPRNPSENRRNRVGIPIPDTTDEEQVSLALAQIALDLGVDVNAADDGGNTALHDAVRRRFGAVVEFLAANGAQLDAVNERGQTALVLAETPQSLYGTNGLRATRPEIAELLRRLGASN